MHKIKHFVMSLSVLMLFVVTGANANECPSDGINMEETISDSWTADCNSTHRPDSYAKFFTFTLTDPASVSINLRSSVDTYLYLLPDANQSSAPMMEDDDGGENANSQIALSLEAGTYTIEATTFGSNEVGDFNLSLNAVTLMEFNGIVTLPSSITDLLASCSGADCPSVDIFVSVPGDEMGYGTAVDYNESSGQYEYHLFWFQEIPAEQASMEIWDKRRIFIMILGLIIRSALQEETIPMTLYCTLMMGCSSIVLPMEDSVSHLQII